MTKAVNIPKVLVVDDVASARLLFATVLEQEGCRVIQASGGEEALRKVHEQRPDLLVLDIGMPGMDGLAVLRALNQAGDTTPVVVITAHKEQDVVVRAARQGVVSYLTKPVNLTALRQRVREALDRGPVPHGAGEASPSPAAPAREPAASRAPEPEEAPAGGAEDPCAFPPPRTIEPEALPIAPGALGLADLALYLQHGARVLGRMAGERAELDRLPAAELQRVLQQAAGRLRASLARERLAAAFACGDPAVRIACAGLVPAEVEPAAAVDLLRGWEVDENYRVRAAVAAKLGTIDHPRVFAGLIPLLYDSVEETRAAATKALQRYPLSRVCAVALAYTVRSGQEIAPALRESVAALQARARRTLWERLLRDKTPEVPGGAVRLLYAAAPQDAPGLATEVVDAMSPAVRAAYLRGLASVRVSEAVELLFARLGDPVSEARWAAWDALRGVKMRPATRVLHERLRALPEERWAPAGRFLREIEGCEGGLAGLLDGLPPVAGADGHEILGFLEACAEGTPALAAAVRGFPGLAGAERGEAARRIEEGFLA